MNCSQYNRITGKDLFSVEKKSVMFILLNLQELAFVLTKTMLQSQCFCSQVVKKNLFCYFS